MPETSLLAHLGGRRPSQVAVERVKDFLLEHRPRWLYVMYSGGKDSVAALYASLRAATDLGVPVAAVYIIVPGLTHGDNVGFVRRSWERLCPGCPIRVIRARVPGDVRWRIVDVDRHTLFMIVGHGKRPLFWDLVRIWGLPGPSERTGAGLRWCEPEHKGRWQRELPPNGRYGGRLARFLVVGVRRSESAYRARRWPSGSAVTTYEEGGVVDVALSPIYDMSSADAWSIVEEAGLRRELARLYRVWGNSPNCVVCPLRSDRLNRQALERLPTPWLRLMLDSLLASRDRWKRGTFVREKTEKWIAIIQRVLEKRSEKRQIRDGGSP